ncbi:MAG: hypothetical protein K5762_07450 [Bacilli bacterium]|nr:hypothetical protein [Bacilli bacterium]
MPQNKMRFYTICAAAGTTQAFVLFLLDGVIPAWNLSQNIGKIFFPMFSFIVNRNNLALEEMYHLSFFFTILFFYGIFYVATYLLMKKFHIGTNPNIRKPSSIIQNILDIFIFLFCTYGMLSLFLIEIREILPLGDGILGWLFNIIYEIKA